MLFPYVKITPSMTHLAGCLAILFQVLTLYNIEWDGKMFVNGE